MCKLQSLIREKFSSSRILNTQSADEIIALGCAKECGLISNSKHLKEIQNTDLNFKCTSAPVFLKVTKSKTVVNSTFLKNSLNSNIINLRTEVIRITFKSARQKLRFQ